MVLTVAAAACSAFNGFGPPPGTDQVNGPVQVSADGRVIIAVGPVACGHAPRLVARSYPGKVTLTFINPDTNCNAEMIGLAAASTRLAQPLGARRLVQPVGQPIASFSQADLAHVTKIPAAFRLSSDLPSAVGQQPGDLRTYVSAQASAARLTVLQIVASSPVGRTNLRASHIRIHGYRALLRADYVRGITVSRSVSWAEHGYWFTAGIFTTGGQQVPLSARQLVAFAAAIRLSPSQYR